MSLLFSIQLLLSLYWPVNFDAQNAELPVFLIRETSQYEVDASYYFRVFEDSTLDLTLSEVQSYRSEFQRFDSNELNRKSAYWTVFRVRNESSESQNFAMLLGYNTLVEVHEEDKDGNINVRKSGYLMPIPERDIEHDGDAKVRLILNPNQEKTLWIRTQQLDNFPPFLELSLVPYNEWEQRANREDLFEGVFTGILVVLALLGLIFYSYTKERMFLFYGIYAILHALYFFSFYGYINIYLFPNNPVLTQFTWVLQIPIFAFYFAFISDFLKAKDFEPGWHKWFKTLIPGLIVLFLMISAYLFITHNLREAIWVKNIVTLFNSLFSMVFIVAMLRTRRDQAYYLAFASTLLLIGYVYISVNFFFREITYDPILVQAGILLELIVLSMGIGHETRAGLMESKITQDSLILQFRENEKLQQGITQKLEESVAERTHQLNLQKRELQNARSIAEKATSAKSEFLSVMSHEIRTPLNAIISLTHLMELENENPENQEYIDALKFSGESLHSLINDILDYSKIEAGKLELEAVSFSILDLLKKVVASFKFKAQAKGIDLLLKIGEYTPDRLLGDPTRLTQVMNNLISNAIKFTTFGNVTVHSYLVGIRDETATIGFEISDTGIGIPQEKIKDIFEEYEQTSRDTTRKYGGTGLGLAITKKLLDLHNAEIKIKSIEGEGTTFTFDVDFKLDSDFEVFETAQGPDSKFNLNQSKILVVDDNDMNRLVLKRLLKKWNAEYYESSSGKAAFELANEIQFDLILMDIEMEGMDGFETAGLIQEKSELNKETRIIAMSARADYEAQTKASDSSMSEFIRKPFDPQILFKRISQSLTSRDGK